jgi:hypothetical protein
MKKAAPRGRKITLEVPDELLKAAKLRMIEDDTNLRTVIITALERHLGASHQPKTAKGGKHAR